MILVYVLKLLIVFYYTTSILPLNPNYALENLLQSESTSKYDASLHF